MHRSLAFLACVTSFVLAIASCGSRTGLGDVGGTGGGVTTSATGGHGGGTGGGGKCPAAITCASKGLDCGVVGDGCGSILDCGTCTKPGETCGGGSVPNVCGTSCLTTSCPALGFDCGLTGDGCQGTLDCGACPGGQECGASQVPTRAWSSRAPAGRAGSRASPVGSRTTGAGTPSTAAPAPPGRSAAEARRASWACAARRRATRRAARSRGSTAAWRPTSAAASSTAAPAPATRSAERPGPNACGANGLCTGLSACSRRPAPGNGTTSVTGTVFAPQGIWTRSPGCWCYVPNGPVAPFAARRCSRRPASRRSPSARRLVRRGHGVDGTVPPSRTCRQGPTSPW